MYNYIMIYVIKDYFKWVLVLHASYYLTEIDSPLLFIILVTILANKPV